MNEVLLETEVNGTPLMLDKTIKITDWAKMCKALDFAEKHWNVKYSGRLTQSYGMCKSFRDGRSVISCAKGNSKEKTLSIILHEIAHSILHPYTCELPHRSKEVEAEAVAYLVGKKLGIDTIGSSAWYIRYHIGKRDRFTVTQRILNTVNEIAKVFSEAGVTGDWIMEGVF